MRIKVEAGSVGHTLWGCPVVVPWLGGYSSNLLIDCGVNISI